VQTPEVRSLSFTGGDAGRHRLSWGQKWIWRSVVLNHPRHQFLNLRIITPIPAGLSTATVLKGISTLLGRHQALRTRFGVDGMGIPFQVVAGKGEISVAIHETPEDDDFDRRAEEILAGLADTPFAMSELAVRAAITTVHGQPVHALLAMFHATCDGVGAQRIVADLQTLMSGDAAPLRQQKIVHPADRVAYEKSADGLAQSRRSVAFWEREVAKFNPVPPEPERASSNGFPFPEISIRSRALTQSLEILAAHFNVGLPAVLVALSARLLCARSATTGIGFLVFCHNRIDKRTRALSSTIVQNFPIYVDVGARSLEAILKSVNKGLLVGFIHGQYDPDSLSASLDELAKRRGTEPDLSYAVNVFTDPQAVGSRTAPAPAGRRDPQDVARELHMKLASTGILESPGPDRDDMSFYLTAALDSDALIGRVRVNAARHSRADAVDFLKDLEHSAVREAVTALEDPVRLLGGTVSPDSPG